MVTSCTLLQIRIKVQWGWPKESLFYTPLSVNTEYFSESSVGGRTLTTDVWCGFSISVTTKFRPVLGSCSGTVGNSVCMWHGRSAFLGYWEYWVWRVKRWYRVLAFSSILSSVSLDICFLRFLENCYKERNYI